MKWIKSYPFWICIAISTLIWYFFYLVNDTSLKVKMKLEYIDVPEDYVLSYKSSDYVYVTFDMKGQDVGDIRSQVKYKTILINLKDVNPSHSSAVEYTFSPSLQTKNQLQDLLNKAVDFEVVTDSVKIVLEAASSKTVPIRDDFSYTTPSGCMILPGAGFSYDSIEICGLPSVINDLDFISFGRRNLGKINTTFCKEFVVSDYYPQIAANPSSVLYTINVADFTEYTLSLNITDFIEGKYRFFPDSVKVQFHVALSEFVNVTPSSFSLNINFPDGEANKAYITLNKFPDFINIVDVYPYIVEYLIFE